MAVRRNLWIPADRLLTVIDKRPDYRKALANTNFADRTIRHLRDGTQKFISLDSADRILTKLDLVHWFQIPQEQDGLADIYVDGEQYGAPDRTHTTRPRPSQRRYETERERREARLQTYRDSYQRRKERRAA